MSLDELIEELKGYRDRTGLGGMIPVYRIVKLGRGDDAEEQIRDFTIDLEKHPQGTASIVAIRFKK